MRILLLSKQYPPDIGGINTAVRSMSLALAEGGHEPFVLCADQGMGTGDSNQEGIRVRRFPYRHGPGEITLPGRDAHYLWKVLPVVLDEFKPEMVWSCWPNFSIALAYHEGAPPFIHIPPNAHTVNFTSLLSSAPTKWRSPKWLANAILWTFARWRAVEWERRVLQACLLTIVFSQNVKRQFVHYYPGYQEKVKVAYPGSDHNRFRAIPKDLARQKIAGIWEIPNDRLLFLYVGRLDPDKPIDLMFRAFHLLKNQDPDTFARLHLLIVGQGSQESFLKRLASDLEINATFCGPQREELPYYYSAAWCLVLPSKIESFGFVLVEAGLCGTPSIAFLPHGQTVRTAADEIISHRETGLLANPASVQGLADAIREAASWSNEMQTRIGQAARQHMLTKFRWDRFVNTVIQITQQERTLV